jgi:hypothetical protein
MADDRPDEPLHRRPTTRTGPAVVALLSLSACGAQGATPKVEFAQIDAAPVAAIYAPMRPAPGSP